MRLFSFQSLRHPSGIGQGDCNGFLTTDGQGKAGGRCSEAAPLSRQLPAGPRALLFSHLLFM